MGEDLNMTGKAARIVSGRRSLAALRVAILTAVVAASVFAIAPDSAEAFPSDCRSGYYTGTPGNTGTPIAGWVHCSGGTGQFRAVVKCDKPWALDYTRYGPWKSIGQPASYAFCDSGHEAYNVRMELFGPV
jgi:hypothetical protein